MPCANRITLHHAKINKIVVNKNDRSRNNVNMRTANLLKQIGKQELPQSAAQKVTLR